MLFIVLQDLRPLYAGRCDYHSSETASERDVRNTHFTYNAINSSSSVRVFDLSTPCLLFSPGVV